MIDATRTRATSLRPCFLTLLCSFSFIRITVSHLFDARLQPPCSCPWWKRNLNDTCLELPLRAAKIVCGREGNCELRAQLAYLH